MIAPPLPGLPTPLHRWASLRSELLWVHDGIITPDNFRVVTDLRYGYGASLLRTGQAQVKTEGKVWKANAGQWIVAPHGHSIHEFSPGARTLSIHFRCQWPTGENLFADRDAVILEARDFPHLERSAMALKLLTQRHFPKASIDYSLQPGDYPLFLHLQQVFSQWLLDFYHAMVDRKKPLSQAGSSDNRLFRAEQCLQQAPLDLPFPASMLRKETGLGRAQLDRLYWREFGLTTRVYWERLREESAKRSLEATKLSIKEIGGQLGFRQASHFTKWFRHRLRATPSEYREQALNRAAIGQAGRPPIAGSRRLNTLSPKVG